MPVLKVKKVLQAYTQQETAQQIYPYQLAEDLEGLDSTSKTPHTGKLMSLKLC
jgi:hypothetical protein